MLYLFFLYNLTQQPAERGRPVFFIVFKLQRFSQPWLPTLYMVPGSEMVRLDQVARVRPPRPKPLPSPETETGAGAARRRATVSIDPFPACGRDPLAGRRALTSSASLSAAIPCSAAMLRAADRDQTHRVQAAPIGHRPSAYGLCPGEPSPRGCVTYSRALGTRKC
jgi:hypothetical protein